MLLKKKYLNNDFLINFKNRLISKYGLEAIKKKKVLWVEWFSDGREIEQMKFIIIFLKDILDWDIDFVSSFNPLSAFSKEYNLAIISGLIGAKRGLNWAKVIFRDSKIPLFTSHTEGIYRESEIEEFVWGHQKVEKKVLWTKCSHWSKKSLQLTKKYYPSLMDSFFVSGSLGIDSFIIENENKEKYDIAIILNDDFVSLDALQRNFGERYANRWLKQFHLPANRKLVDFIKKYSNFGYTFLVKPHPALTINEHKVVTQIKNLRNVKVVNSYYSIQECLYSSRIFVMQNSTTATQALSLKKPVFRVGEYPTCFDEYQYLPDLTNLEDELAKKDLNRLIDDYDFNYLNKAIIHNTLGYIDGFNHLRFIENLLGNEEIYKAKKIRFNLIMIKYSMIFYVLKFVQKLKLPFFKSFQDRYKRFDLNLLNNNFNESSKRLINFYESNIDKILKIID